MTPRRWLAFCNPELSALITKTLGSDRWITHTDELQGLLKYADDKGFQTQWRNIKQDNKQRFASKIKVTEGRTTSSPTGVLHDWFMEHCPLRVADPIIKMARAILMNATI